MLQIVASLTDDFRGIIYTRNIFKMQATGVTNLSVYKIVCYLNNFMRLYTDETHFHL